MPKTALLIVDVQNDFCPGGALAVPEGDQVVPVLNQYIQFFSAKKLPVFASRDWHPQRTTHFKKFGGIWPAHCVQETQGAKFHPDLKLPRKTIVLSKGMSFDKDSYSAFQAFDDGLRPFKDILNDLKITELYIGGLATDYCVKSSVLDALNEGLAVKLLMDAIKGVNLKSGDDSRAIEEMRKKGAIEIQLGEVKNLLTEGSV